MRLMRTVLVGQPPPEVEELLARRRALGQDLFDEVWEGEYHMVPAPHRRYSEVDHELAGILRPLAKRAGLQGAGPANVGEPNNYRVPDQSYYADRNPQVFNPTAEIVIEIVSPDDESRQKFDFYFRVGVKEVGILDPAFRTVEWYERGDGGFRPADGSSLLGITTGELVKQIGWPE
jgi:Uma2 family endonuclease